MLALKGGLDERSADLDYPRIHELPFDAKRKRMTTIHRHQGQEIAFVKGAPREVLQLCTQIHLNGAVVPLTNELRAEIMAANDDYARNALRVLGLAMRELPIRSGRANYTPESVERELTFLGLAAMMDPPRPEVADAVKKISRRRHSHRDDHRRLWPDRRVGGAPHRPAEHAGAADSDRG